jgi:peptide/nickel transport system permease protein
MSLNTTTMTTWSRWLGLVGLGLVGLLAVVGPMVLAPPAVDLGRDLAGPDGATVVGLLGFGEGGTSVVASLVWGARGAVTMGAAVSLASTLLSLLVAMAMALGPRSVRLLLGRLVDVMLTFPSLLLAAALSAVLRPGAASVVLVLVVSSWAQPARVLSGLAAAVAARDHVTAAVALGASPFRVARLHVLPLVWPTVLLQLSQGFGGAIVAEASLAFLGLSQRPLAPPCYASWGTMLDDGVALLVAAPHLWWPPALAVFVVAACAQLAAPTRGA